MGNILEYIRECWTTAVAARERQKAMMGLVAALFALPVIWAAGGKVEPTPAGLAWIAAWVTLSGLLHLFVIAPFLIWRNEKRVANEANKKVAELLNEYAHSIQVAQVDREERRHVDQANNDAVIGRDVRLAIRFKNSLNRPVGYAIRRMVVDGAEQTNFFNLGGIIGAGSGTTFYTERKKSETSAADLLVLTKIEFEYSYGNPNQHTRLASKVLNLEAYTSSGLVTMMYEKEEDREISKDEAHACLAVNTSA
jgi:hypothetical protein